ncbi:MAG: YdcH family protein [Bdellovibrionales bacterium]
MALMQRIESLKKRHADVDHLLHEEEIRPAPDIVRLHELKRIKLNLKDEVTRLTNGHEEAA